MGARQGVGNVDRRINYTRSGGERREGMSGEPTEHTLDLRKVEDRYARGERKGAGSAGGAETISVPPDWRSKERD